MNSKTRPPQGPPAKGATAPADAKPPAPTPPAVAPVPPLFRRIDWLTLGITFAIVWVIYYVCLAPEVTLEDSGELCTASYYAGIPHPPGYPFWTIYTWLWTVLVPFKNIAWRVALAEASTAAAACGVLALLMRWNYAPHQRRYLYTAFFFLGICSTIHQTLLMAIMGIEIGVMARQPKLGRDMFFLNSVGYVLGLIGHAQHLVGMFDATNPMVFRIFNAVGLC